MAGKTTPKPVTLTSSWDLVLTSFNLVRAHYLQLIYLILLPGLIYSLGILLISSGLQADGSLVLGTREKQGLVVALIGLVWTVVNLGPLTYFEVEVIEGRAPSLGETYKKGLTFTLPLIGLSILFGLLVIGGLLLFIIPGLIFMRRYILSPYYLISDKRGIFAALSRSAKDSKIAAGYIWGSIGVGLAFALVSAYMQSIPLIGIIIGQLITITVTFLLALRYKEVRTKTS